MFGLEGVLDIRCWLCKVFWWLKTPKIFSEFILTMDWWFLSWLSTFSHISNILAFMESVRKSFGILVYELSSRWLCTSVPIVLGPTFSSADILLSNAVGIFSILVLRAIMKLIIVIIQEVVFQYVMAVSHYVRNAFRANLSTKQFWHCLPYSWKIAVY